MGRFGDLWASGKFTFYEKKKKEGPAPDENRPMDIIAAALPELDISSSSREVLRELQSRRGQETGRWLKGLAQEVSSQAPKEASPSPVSIFEALASWMDTLFDQFLRLTFEFNKSSTGVELLVTCDRPTVREKKNEDVWYKPVTKIYQGRIATRQWALLVTGKDGRISIHMLPAAMVLAFNTGELSDQECQPLMTAELSNVGGKNCWIISGEVAPMETIPRLAKELFGDLIRVASGVLDDSELSAADTVKAALGGSTSGAAAIQQKPEPPIKEPQPQRPDIESMKIADACDVVDAVIEQELKKLYGEAAQLKADSPEAPVARRKISTVESFRRKVLQAFEEFTRESQQ